MAKNTPESIEFSTSVSFEYDLKPVLTHKEAISASDFESAFKSAIYRACKKYPNAKPRSMVCVVERLERKPDGEA